MKRHILKSFPIRFQAILDGSMTGETRNNNRNFKVGDAVTLVEGTELEKGNFIPTGRSINVKISYIDKFMCKSGRVTLSYSNLGLLIAEGVLNDTV